MIATFLRENPHLLDQPWPQVMPGARQSVASGLLHLPRPQFLGRRGSHMGPMGPKSDRDRRPDRPGCHDTG